MSLQYSFLFIKTFVLTCLFTLVVGANLKDEDFRKRIEEFDKGLPPIGGYRGDLEDVKFIRCQVCEAFVNETSKKIIKDKKKVKGGKLSNSHIVDLISEACDPKSKQGKWISHYDIDESSTKKLSIARFKKAGKCKQECKTIVLACEDILKGRQEFISKSFYDNQSRIRSNRLAIIEDFCRQPCLLTPALPSDRVKFDEEFEEKNENDKFIDSLNSQLRNFNFKSDL